MFVSYCFDQCGLIPSVLPNKYASCGTEVTMLRNSGRFRERNSGYVPKPGDIIFFRGTTTPSSHTGIVTGSDGNKVYTIEGNSGQGGWRNSKVVESSYSLTSTYVLRIYGIIGGIF